MSERRRRRRPSALPEPATYYDKPESKYPDAVRVSFRDGSTAVYDIRRDQPHPMVMESIRIIRKWNGYNNQPMRRRKKP